MSRLNMAMILGFLGTVCMMSVGMHVFPANIATFAGVVCYMAIGLVYALPERKRSEEKKGR